MIVSSDKTQLTLFRDKMAYLIDLTIGNILKDIHWKPLYHAQLLIGYIPTTKLEGMPTKAGCHYALANLFHFCMQNILGSISSVGKTKIVMISGDSVWH